VVGGEEGGGEGKESKGGGKVRINHGKGGGGKGIKWEEGKGVTKFEWVKILELSTNGTQPLSIWTDTCSITSQYLSTTV